MQSYKLIVQIICCLFLTGCLKNDKPQEPEPLPNIEFIVNKTACLFGQGVLNHELSSQNISGFIEKVDKIMTANVDPGYKTSFVHCLINQEFGHIYMTRDLVASLRSALLEYDPIFDRKKDELNSRKAELTKFFKKFFKKSDAFFQQVLRFYDNSSFKLDEKFNVYLYPFNKESSGIAEVFDNDILLQLVYPNKQAQAIGSVLHAVCLKIYQENFRQFAFRNKSHYAIATHFLLNEILATTIGDRLACRLMSGNSDDKDSPGRSKYANEASKAMAPLVSKYLSDNKKIDEDLFEQAVKIVEKDCKDSNMDFNVMFKKINLITETKELFPVSLKALLKEFNVLEADEVVNNPCAIVFVGKNLGDPVLAPVHAQLPVGKVGDFMFVAVDENKKIYVIISSVNEANIAKAVEKLKEQKLAVHGFTCDL